MLIMRLNAFRVWLHYRKHLVLSSYKITFKIKTMKMSNKYIPVSYENSAYVLSTLHKLGIEGYEYALKMTWDEWYSHFRISTIFLYVDFDLMTLFDKITRNETLDSYKYLDELEDELKNFLLEKEEIRKNAVKQEIASLKQKIAKLELSIA